VFQGGPKKQHGLAEEGIREARGGYATQSWDEWMDNMLYHISYTFPHTKHISSEELEDP